MEDGEIKNSPAKDEVINLNYKMFQFLLICLAMFSSVATDSESQIRIEIFLEYADSHPHFIECVKNGNICLPEKIPYLKLLEPPDKPSISEIWSTIVDHSPPSLNIDQFFKEKVTDKKILLSKVECFLTYIGSQIRSAQFLKLIAIIPLALLCVITACYAKYFFSYISCIITLDVSH